MRRCPEESLPNPLARTDSLFLCTTCTDNFPLPLLFPSHAPLPRPPPTSPSHAPPLQGGFLSYDAWLDAVRLLGMLGGSGSGSGSGSGYGGGGGGGGGAGEGDAPTSSSAAATVQLARRVFDAFRPSMRPAAAGAGGGGGGEACVAFAPFVAGLCALSSSPPEDKFAVAFALLDGDCDGSLTLAEFGVLVQSMLRVVLACSALAQAKLAEGCAGRGGSVLGALQEAVVAEARRTSAARGGVSSSLQLLSREALGEMVVDCLELSGATTL